MRAATQAAQTGLARALDTLSEAGAAPVTAGAGQAARTLLATDQELAALHSDLLQGPAGVPSALRRVDTLEAQNQQFEQFAQRVNSIPPETLVSPFQAEATNVRPVQPTALAYYTPAVIALLLQHMAITLAALSSVRDRLLGSLELFRVSPVSAGNILTGKSLAYAFMLALVAVILTSAATTFLGVPSLGDPLHYWVSVGLTIFSALAIGFALSTIADSESQAVQLSMLLLLASVFFGGFFLPLEQLFPWVRALSFLLPVTYGSIDLREVMLRGIAPEWPYLVGPLVLGLFFYVIATLGLRRQMERA
jgi:ABC-2 type transport system permease protein